MNKKPLPEQFRRNTAVALIACLFVFLWLPTLDLFFHLDRSPMPNENRALARFPELAATTASVHDFPAGLEAYFRDHFGFRNRLIRWERRWKHDLFKESATPDVITGQAGWLYFSGDYMMETFQGLRKFSPVVLQGWQALLEKRRDWLAQRGIKYLFVIPPDKQSIHPEFLPAWLAQRGASNKLDQFLAHMKAHSTVEVLDLRPVLLEGKKSACTYLQTDTHWNSYGGFLTYQALVRALAKQLPGLGEPLPLTAFDQHPSHLEPGDLAKMLGQVSQIVESNAVTLIPRPPLGKPILKSAPDRLPKKWRSKTEPAVTEYAAPTPKAVIFRDSFAGSWTWFLGYHFHEVVYIWQYEWDAAFIEREKPAVVIDEMLERFLNNEAFLSLMQKEVLP